VGDGEGEGCGHAASTVKFTGLISRVTSDWPPFEQTILTPEDEGVVNVKFDMERGW
jgi:hypothetical protein